VSIFSTVIAYNDEDGYEQFDANMLDMSIATKYIIPPTLPEVSSTWEESDDYQSFLYNHYLKYGPLAVGLSGDEEVSDIATVLIY